jgi:peptide-methionine (S)-S-oxide reductase
MMEKIVLGGGCFWCLEAVFQRVDGVTKVVSGYAGGTEESANYKDVCTGTTDHAEVVELTYDTTKTSLAKILHAFWKTHNPTTLNYQGADHGRQYRSCIYYTTPSQLEVINVDIAKIVEIGVYPDPIVTVVEPLVTFYPAEPYHQDYFNQHPGQGYCQLVIAPKLKKLEEL